MLTGGPFGSTTDYASDAMVEYSPNMYHITLSPIPLLQSNDGGFAVERGTHAKIEQESIRTERQVRGFILRNHANLTADISRGQGEYLSSLYTMLRLSQGSETLKRFRSIAARYQEPIPFAEVVLFEYPVDAPAAPPQAQKTNQGRR
jgi:hypothetical protein